MADPIRHVDPSPLLQPKTAEQLNADDVLILPVRDVLTIVSANGSRRRILCTDGDGSIVSIEVDDDTLFHVGRRAR